MNAFYCIIKLQFWNCSKKKQNKYVKTIYLRQFLAIRDIYNIND